MRATLILSVEAFLIEIDPCYFRPTEVAPLVGDASKARKRLGWQPTTHFEKPGTRNDRGRSLHDALIPIR